MDRQAPAISIYDSYCHASYRTGSRILGSRHCIYGSSRAVSRDDCPQGSTADGTGTTLNDPPLCCEGYTRVAPSSTADRTGTTLNDPPLCCDGHTRVAPSMPHMPRRIWSKGRHSHFVHGMSEYLLQRLRAEVEKRTQYMSQLVRSPAL